MQQTCFFIRAERQFIKVRYDEIIYVESLHNYVRIVGRHFNHMTLLSLRQLEGILPAEMFCRIHRSCIISIDHVITFNKEGVTLSNNARISFGDNYKGALEARVNIISSDFVKKPAFISRLAG
jgi:DNA-binding LytR/AlgR family response regulator